MESLTCAHCGYEIDPYDEDPNFQGPVPCAACHKSTWVSIDNGQLVETQKWPTS